MIIERLDQQVPAEMYSCLQNPVDSGHFFDGQQTFENYDRVVYLGKQGALDGFEDIFACYKRGHLTIWRGKLNGGVI